MPRPSEIFRAAGKSDAQGPGRCNVIAKSRRRPKRWRRSHKQPRSGTNCATAAQVPFAWAVSIEVVTLFAAIVATTIAFWPKSSATGILMPAPPGLGHLCRRVEFHDMAAEWTTMATLDYAALPQSGILWADR